MKTKTKSEPKVEEAVRTIEDRTTDEIAGKELRGRAPSDVWKDRVQDPRPEPAVVEEVDKSEWKEAANKVPAPVALGNKVREPEPEPEPARERTAEEIAAKETRGLIPTHSKPIGPPTRKERVT